MEAQAAGLRIVTSPIAALNETVGPRGVMIPGDWLSPDYQNKFVDAVVEAMNKTDDSDREILKKYAEENFGWDSLANDWEKMFESVIEEVSTNMIPPYKGYL
jgi:glycosyltransferase involved in cell wall biosynthesis